MSYRYRIIVVVFLSSMICACGFHLRGSLMVPEERLPLQVKFKNQRIGKTLQQILIRQNMVALENQVANSVILIGDEKWRKRIVAVDSLGRPIQYELNYIAEFSIQTTNENRFVKADQIKISREYSFISEQVLASDSEIERLKNEILTSAASRILRRFAFM